MRIYLHPDMQLQGSVLIDTALQVHYTLTTDTAWLLARLSREHRAERIISSAARHKHITTSEARNALYTLLGFMDAIGGVYVYGLDFRYVLLQRAWRQRMLPTASGFVRTMVIAYGVLVGVLTVGIFGLWLWIGVSAWWLVMPFVVFMSCGLHEIGHLYTVRHYKLPHTLLASRFYAAVLYQTPGLCQARCIAAAGPLVTVIVYTLLALIIRQSGMAILLAAVAIVHGATLLPWFADGKTLWRKQ